MGLGRGKGTSSTTKGIMNARYVISINISRQDIIMPSPSTNQGKTSSCHLHQRIMSSPSCDQSKVISIMSKTHGSKASYGMGSNHMHQWRLWRHKASSSHKQSYIIINQTPSPSSGLHHIKLWPLQGKPSRMLHIIVVVINTIIKLVVINAKL